MRVYTAPEPYYFRRDDISIFLAGGIQHCRNWQDTAIKLFQKRLPDDRYVLFNPRRPTFPINDPTAAEKQIAWEFANLERADYFFCYFDDPTKSQQPIVFYELGRHLCRWVERAGFSEAGMHFTVAVNSEFSRKNDVIIQTRLANGYCDAADIVDNANWEESFERVVDEAAYKIAGLSNA